MVFVVLDEHGDSINDATFMHNPGAAQNQEKWRDLPASYHNNAGSFSFADGHSEIHKWLEGSRTAFPVTFDTTTRPWNGTQVINRDYEWLQDRMPYAY